MRVLLIGPDYEENLSIRYLSGSLRNAGHETILATFNSASDLTSVARAARNADLVGLSMCFQSRAGEFLQLAEMIKSDDPKKLVIAGGHYASCAAEPLLAHHPEIDIIAIHEAEETLVEIADAAEHMEERLPQIAGIAYRDKQSVRLSHPRTALSDLDTLPFPDRGGPIHLIAGVPTSYMMGSRGCYGSCAYCCITTLHRMAPGKRFRQRNPERIADEMADLYHDRGTRQFVFHDDNFLVPSATVNHARLSAFDAALSRRGLHDIALVIKCRPADASRDVLRRLKELGLVRLFLGIESSTERGLATLERKQSVGDSERALDACAELDISAQFTLMIFNPDATLDTVRSDVAFMRRYCGNPLNFCRTEIYAGTPLEQRMIALGRTRGDYLAREYRLLDPAADLACDRTLDLFHARCWSSDSLMQIAIGLDHVAAVSKRFYRGPRQRAVVERAAAWLRSVNLDTIDLLEDVVELSASQSGIAGAALEDGLHSIRQREEEARERLLAEGLKLRSEMEALRFAGSERRPAEGSGVRFARQAAAALLAIGIPAGSGCSSGVTEMAPPPLKQKEPAPPPELKPQPRQYFGISEMAAPPLMPGLSPPTSTQQKLCSLAGTVTDPSGAVISNAAITITNLDSGWLVKLRTNQAGQYEAKGLKSGRYSVKVQVQGFRDSEKTGLVLKPDKPERVDFTLNVIDLGCCEYAAEPLKVQVPQEEAPSLPNVLPVPAPSPQNSTCSLQGTVTDPSGAVIASATITIINVETQKAQTVTTDYAGHYTSGPIAGGHYRVRAEAKGFSSAEKADIVLNAGDRQEADMALKVERVDFTLQVVSALNNDMGCCEYAAAPLRVSEEELLVKKKPFDYVVGDYNDHNTFQGIARLVYGDPHMWVQIFEANRSVVDKPGDSIPSGRWITIPPRRRNVPKLIAKVKPVYPQAAKDAHAWGDVVMNVALKDDGVVDKVEVIDGPSLLSEAATSAVKQWRYRPLQVKGQAVSEFVVVVSFSHRGGVSIR